MKRTCYLVVMALFGLVVSKQSAHCQEQKKPPEKIPNNHASTDYRWDISLDAYRFRAAPAMSPFFTLRYAPNPRGAFRWSIGNISWLSEKSAKGADSSGTLPADAEFWLHRRVFNIVTSFGYEFRRNLKMGQLLYGVDAWLYWNNNYQYSPPETWTTIVELSLGPFCGYKYQLNKRFSASVETCMVFSYEWQKSRNQKGRYNYRDRHIGIEPNYISRLNFTFHF